MPRADLSELPPFVDSAKFAEVLGCARKTVWAAWRDEGGVVIAGELVAPVSVGRALRWPTAPLAALGGKGPPNAQRPRIKAGAAADDAPDGDPHGPGRGRGHATHGQ